MGQVTHALLTRPPLSHKELHSEEICSKCFVRLACVKHAASVHPEPGSNSLIKFDSGSRTTLGYPVSFYCFGSLNRSFFVKNFRELIFTFSVQMMCVSLFSYQGSLLLFSRDSLFILSQSQSLVNNFFYFFKTFSCSERRRRDLNPRAAQTTYTLSRGTSSAT